MIVDKMSLLEEMRREYPHKFRVDPHSSLDYKRNLKVNNSCLDCIVKDNRSPDHCDPCPDNPDRKRLIRAGLLNP